MEEPTTSDSAAAHRPLRLGANLPPRFYRGGAAIARFRDEPVANDHVPEDWVASTTTLFGEAALGLSRLPGGPLLSQAVAAAPEAWLGPEHVRRFGADPALLVKLLDAGQRLPVHCHPGDDWARRHLGTRWGKTESWVVLATGSAEAAVHLGFREEVALETLAAWVERQEAKAILGALHRVRVEPGDAILVPAGIPHTIGEGVFVVELQQPSDLSVMLEWRDFGLDGAREGHLGVGYATALSCVDRSGWEAERLASLQRSRGAGRATGPSVERVLPPEADRFFRAERVRPRPQARLEASFSVLIVTAGWGTLETGRGPATELRRGDTVLVPHAAGEQVLRGHGLELIRCLPPHPGRADDA